MGLNPSTARQPTHTTTLERTPQLAQDLRPCRLQSPVAEAGRLTSMADFNSAGRQRLRAVVGISSRLAAADR